jgi:hypothetical protein
MTPLAAYLQFYATPAPMTDISACSDRLEHIPQDIAGLVKLLQGLLVHIFWAERYGISLSDERKSEVNLRPAARRFARLFELDPAPLTNARPLERKLVSNCRDFSVMLVALLRHQGIPARARCGFGTYFIPGHYEDHWVVEVWDGERWLGVDAQLDELQCQALHIPFYPLDLPPGAFVTGGQAWQLCRAGKANPDDFGIFEWKGWDFIRGNLFRDLLSFDRFEILPWDFWPALEKPLEESSESVWKALDDLAKLEVYSQADLDRLQAALRQANLYPPAEWAD